MRLPGRWLAVWAGAEWGWVLEGLCVGARPRRRGAEAAHSLVEGVCVDMAALSPSEPM